MKRKVSVTAPKATKSAHFNVPAPQRERIVKKFIGGQCIRKISREEGRSRGTVSRIVNSTEVRDYVLEIRAAYYGLGGEALDAVRRALRTNKDGKIAYQLLVDIGVVPNQDDRQPLNGTPEADEEADVQKQMALLFQCAVERSLLYCTPLGGMEKHLEAVGGRLNYETGKVDIVDPTLVADSSQLRSIKTRGRLLKVKA